MNDERRVYRVRGDSAEWVDDHLVAEAPIEFRLGSTPIAVLMRTPGDDADLGLGFAITEGIVLNPGEVASVRAVPETSGDDRWMIELSEGVTVDPEQFRRNLYTTSSCGVCGKASIDAVRIAAAPLVPGPKIEAETLLAMPVAMRDRQQQFTSTGGIHAAAIFEPDGRVAVLREDIGRHNAVDKVVGSLARTRWPLGETVLLVSGRVSFEMVQKAAVAGIPIVCGVSAASSLAVDLGAELGVTVIGFLRDDGFNVYCGDERIV